MLNRLKKQRQRKRLRVFVWQTFNAGAVAIGSLIAPLNTGEMILVFSIVTPLLSLITKKINTKFFGDLGVVNPDGTVTIKE